MAYLSRDQIAVYAAAAGAPNPRLAAAIAMAETGGTGNTRSHNPIPPDDSYGLWQINMRGDLGPDRRRKLGITSNSQLYDPATNARAMMLISGGGTNFEPWTTYTSGAYAKYLPAGSGGAVPAGVLDIPGDIIGGTGDLLGNLWDGGTSVIGGAGDVVGWVIKAGKWLSKATNWVRIGYVVGGGALVVVGLALAAKDTELQALSGQLGKVVKKTGLGKVAKS